LPTIARELHASNSQLQWLVDSYTLVFAGLLLTAGSIGDRFGRRGALQAGFVLFGGGSLAAALVTNANQLIAARAFMGIGAAFIMPATLSIITNVFTGAERGRAIAVWAATAGVGGAIGPLTGGFLLEHFYWGSIFLVNLPIVAVGLAAGLFLIPNSKDPDPKRLDLLGAVLSIAGLVTLVYAVIEAPTKGWTNPVILGAFIGGGILLVGFFVTEARSDHPMLELSVFRNARFSAASAAIALTYFAMFGGIFLITQFLQFAVGYSPLATGVKLLPMALSLALFAPISARIVERTGTKVVVATGLALQVVGALLISQLDAGSPYSSIWWRLALIGAGLGLVMAPATESIMGSLPLAKAGVGSAMNDTTRQMGGAVGVAVLGSIFSSIYGTKVVDALRGRAPAAGLEGAKRSIGVALDIARRVGGRAGAALTATIRNAFVDGFHAAMLVAAAVALVGVVVVVLWLPARARRISLYETSPPPDSAPGAAEEPVGASVAANGTEPVSPEPAR